MKHDVSTRELISRALAAVLIILILFPLTRGLAVGGYLYVHLVLESNRAGVAEFLVLIPIFVAACALIALWRVSIDFILRGARCFEHLHRWWWWLIGAGVSLVVLGVLAFLLGMREGAPSWLKLLGVHGSVGFAGQNAVVPAAHLWLEKWWKLRSNKSLERTRER